MVSVAVTTEETPGPPELATNEYWRSLMKRARAEHNLTQKQLGQLVGGASQSIISQIEDGNIRQSRLILPICEKLHIPTPQMMWADEAEQRWVESGRLLRAKDATIFEAHLEMVEALIRKLAGRSD